MAINYRRAVNELAESLVSTTTPATNQIFVDSYNKWASKRESKTAGTPWSAVFVTYVARMAGVPAAIIPNFNTSEELRSWAEAVERFHPRKENYGPKAGDIILFNDGAADHVAFFTEMIGNKVEYIEGILQSKTYTVLKSTRIANSGLIVGYFSPDYDWTSSKGMVNHTQLAAIIKPVRVQEFRDWLTEIYGEEFINNYVSGTPVGSFTKGWQRVVTAAWQKEMHMEGDYVDGYFDGVTCECAADEKPVKLGSRGNRVMLLLGMLYSKGYDCKGWSTRFNANGKAALETFQKARALPINGVADYAVWDALLNH